jgi:hypothetical protein
VPAQFKYFPFDNQESWEAEWRDMMENMRSTGIIVQGNLMDSSLGDCAVSVGNGLEVKIATGRAWIRGHLWKHTSDFHYMPIARNDSGAPRTDLITLRADFTNNKMEYVLLPGPDAVPIQNSTTYDLVLAEVVVPPGAQALSETDIHDRRVTSNQAGFRPFCILRNSFHRSIANDGMVTLTWDVEEHDPTLMHSTQNEIDQIVIKEAGLYEVGCNTVWDTVDNSDSVRRVIVYMRKNNDPKAEEAIAYGTSRGANVSSVAVEVSAYRLIELQPNDRIYVRAFNNSGATVQLKSSGIYSPVLWVMKVGEVKGL